jgi:hypothetical protein
VCDGREWVPDVSAISRLKRLADLQVLLHCYRIDR